MRSPVRIRVAAPDNPRVNTLGLWFFIGSRKIFVGAFIIYGVVRSCYSRFGSSSVPLAQNPVRIPHSEIEECILQAENVGIFAFSEYPGSSRQSRCGSVIYKKKGALRSGVAYALCDLRRYLGGATHLVSAMPKRSQSNLRHSSWRTSSSIRMSLIITDYVRNASITKGR